MHQKQTTIPCDDHHYIGTHAEVKAKRLTHKLKEIGCERIGAGWYAPDGVVAEARMLLRGEEFEF